MNEKELEIEIGKNLVAIQRMEERITWILKKIENRRRKIRELGKLRTESLNLKLDLR